MTLPQETAKPGIHVPGSSETAFLATLARALHMYGTPSHRTEDALVQVAARLGVRARFLVTPTSILTSVGEDDQTTLRLERVDAGETNLDKLERLHQVIRDVFEGTIDAAHARALVDSIVAERPLYRPALTILAFAATGASGARFFDGGLAEIAASAVAGLLVGSFMAFAERRPRLVRLAPAMTGVLAASVAAAAAAQWPLFSPIVVLASLIVLLPGLTLTVAMNELALGHVVSGSARMTSAIGTFLQLGFGVAVGTKLGSILGPASIDAPRHLPEWTIVPALLGTALTLTVLFRARMRHALILLPMTALAYGAARAGTSWSSPEVGAALGSLVLGIAANAVSRWRDIPTAIPLIPGLLLLVPGSLGFRSLQSLLARDVLGGVESAFTMGLVAVGLVSGLLVANLVVTPRRLL